MMHFVKLTRPVNLLVIVLTMLVVHALFLQYTYAGLSWAFITGDVYFILLVLSTVCIAAAGNIINDYFDVRIDRVNKPDKLIVDRYVKKRYAILFHTVLNALAVGMAVIILLGRHTWWPLLFHVITTSVLWLYSMLLKRKFLSGNTAIAALTAMVPMLVYLYDRGVYIYRPGIWHQEAFHTMGYFALFAFCTTLIREIQKDFADMKGDAMYGCKTVPLYLGIRKGRMILFGIFSITIALFVFLFFLEAALSSINITFFAVVCLLMLVSLMQSLKAVKRKAWLNAALTMKLVMIAAILFFMAKLYV